MKTNTDYTGMFETKSPLINDLPQSDLVFSFSEYCLDACLKDAFIIWLCPSTVIADIELAAWH